MKKVIGAAVLGSALIGGSAVGHDGHDYITSVSGSSRYGYAIHWKYGDTEFLPTRSEVIAECEAYGKRWRRARCKGNVNGRYRTLRHLKIALRHN